MVELTLVSIQTQRTQASANRNGRSKQPIIEAANQTLALLADFVYATHATHATHATQVIAFLAVFVYATHAMQSIALRALRLDGNRALIKPVAVNTVQSLPRCL